MNQWYEEFSKENEPLMNEIDAYVNNSLWGQLNEYLQQAYEVQPKLSHSNCSMENGYWKGWNVKYKKGGKALCSLYPKKRYFVALIAVGPKDLEEVEWVIPLCSEYTQTLYHQIQFGKLGKSLPIEVKNEAILEDIKQLVAVREKVRKQKL